MTSPYLETPSRTEIDLKKIEESKPSIGNERKLRATLRIAAVEALRELVERMEARAVEQNIEYMQALGFALDRANKAEARVAELAGALERYRYCRHAVPDCFCVEEARAALATTGAAE